MSVPPRAEVLYWPLDQCRVSVPPRAEVLYWPLDQCRVSVPPRAEVLYWPLDQCRVSVPPRAEVLYWPLDQCRVSVPPRAEVNHAIYSIENNIMWKLETSNLKKEISLLVVLKRVYFGITLIYNYINDIAISSDLTDFITYADD